MRLFFSFCRNAIKKIYIIWFHSFWKKIMKCVANDITVDCWIKICVFFFSDFNCKHFRAALYYAESVYSNTGFVAFKCTSWAAYTEETCENNEKQLMGYPVTPTSNGKYYLRTNAKSPFAQGDL